MGILARSAYDHVILMAQGILVMLAASVVIGLLESFVFSIWCARRQRRFSSKALFIVILGAILGSVVGVMLASVIGGMAQEQLSRFLLNTFCHGDAGAFGICLWMAVVLFVSGWMCVGSSIGGWLGFRVWLAVNFDL
jgi:uncharacterized BrkB/YihY/UPF0761 family membrane protein